jgi:hypothetical protein
MAIQNSMFLPPSINTYHIILQFIEELTIIRQNCEKYYECEIMSKKE